jgi:uncharacterized protein YjbJ (UPF0337 family)
MDRDEIKGKAKDIKGRIKRQAGEWTGNEELETEGTLDQAEGKVQNAWGKVKDAVKSDEPVEEPQRKKPAA